MTGFILPFDLNTTNPCFPFIMFFSNRGCNSVHYSYCTIIMNIEGALKGKKPHIIIRRCHDEMG